MVAMATSALPRLVLSVFWPAVPTTVAASTATDCGANSTFHSTSRAPSRFFTVGAYPMNEHVNVAGPLGKVRL